MMSEVSFVFMYYFHCVLDNISVCKVKLIFIMEWWLIYKYFEDFLQNWHLYVHIDQFSKMVSMCSNLKLKGYHLLYILKAVEPVHMDQNICSFCTIKVQ